MCSFYSTFETGSFNDFLYKNRPLYLNSTFDKYWFLDSHFNYFLYINRFFNLAIYKHRLLNFNKLLAINYFLDLNWHFHHFLYDFFNNNFFLYKDRHLYFFYLGLTCSQYLLNWRSHILQPLPKMKYIYWCFLYFECLQFQAASYDHCLLMV